MIHQSKNENEESYLSDIPSRSVLTKLLAKLKLLLKKFSLPNTLISLIEEKLSKIIPIELSVNSIKKSEIQNSKNSKIF